MLGPRQPWEQLNDLSDVLLTLTARRRAEAAASELGPVEFESAEDVPPTATLVILVDVCVAIWPLPR